MDPNAMVTEQVASGQQLLEALEASGFHVELAFWTKLSESDKWYLYLVVPGVESQGVRPAYAKIDEALATLPDNWLDSLDIRVVGVTDSIAKGAADVVKPRRSRPQSAGQQPVRRRMFWFGGSALGGIPVDGAYIYPPLTQAASA